LLEFYTLFLNFTIQHKEIMKTLLAFLCLLLLAGCSRKNSTDEVDTGFTMLNGKSFVLQVNRAVKAPLMKLPMEELPEADYTVSVSGKNYTVTFSANGAMVYLEPGSMKGERDTSVGSSGYFNLTAGVFAGGRFVIRSVNEKLEGELTIYGSGVPIVLSERGSLVHGN